MNVSIVILNNGDQLICDLKEVFDGENESKKGICLLLVHPYKLFLVENSPDDLHVRFSKWCPFSTDIQFKIPYTTVVAIGQVNESLLQAYLEKVNQLEQTQNQIQESEIANAEVMIDE